MRWIKLLVIGNLLVLSMTLSGGCQVLNTLRAGERVLPISETQEVGEPLITSEYTVEPIPVTSAATVVFLPLDTTVQPALSPLPCESASAGTPLDVTIPDDTPIAPGQRFVKTWRLVNRGACIWDSTYSVVWVSGDNLAPVTAYALPTRVLPGEAVDISIEMVAPPWQGRYTSYWMLRSPSGKLFGLGPAGNAPFWVRIQVPALDTATLLPAPTFSPTPIAVLEGQITLTISQGLHLSDLTLQQDLSKVDFWVEHSAGGMVLSPQNEAQWGVLPFAETPTVTRCLELTQETTPIPLQGESFFPSLCVRSADGAVAFFEVIRVDEERGLVDIHYIRWLTP
jgi:hypothetical protein